VYLDVALFDQDDLVHALGIADEFNATLGFAGRL
jgi:hypothetical protein